MKFYSELTKKLYDSQKQLENDEKAVNSQKAAEEAKKKAEAEARAARAKEVEDAYRESVKAQNHYTELRNAFVKDFGSFHMSFSTESPLLSSNLLDFLFGL